MTLYDDLNRSDPLPSESQRVPADQSTWEPVSLAAVLSSDYKRPVPTVGARDDGMGLFYPGKVHAVGSESEAGKTWLALCTTATELNRGNTVVYLDFEDDEGGIVSRLLMLGVQPDVILARFVYIRPMSPLDKHEQEMLNVLVRDRSPALVVIDGVTEAMVLNGLEMKDNSDIARFQALLPRPLATLGPAVVQLDHVVKNEEARGRYDIGGVHKLNGIDGASYSLINRAAFGIGMTGTSGIFVRKDRPGQLRRNGMRGTDGLYWIGDLVLNSHGEDFAEWSIPLPHGAGQFRPTTLMKQVSDILARNGPLSGRGIQDRATGKAEFIRKAIAALVDDGHVTVAKGARNADIHTLVKPFGGE